jgi:TIR domain
MIKVFISYSWKNTGLREILMHKLREASYSPQWDQNNIPLGDHINNGIIRMLEESDVVVACLTKESIDSRAVFEELTRAHHQYSRIYSIVERSIVSKLPWFLDSDSQLRYTSDEELIECINKFIKSLTQDRDFILSYKTHQGIRQQHHHVYSLLRRKKFESPEGKYLNELAQAIIQNVNDELSSLVNENYESTVGEGSNFLMRAKPVFENASQIYAISIDSVSSFWVGRDVFNQRRARDYLRTQPANTIRLFVFANPDSAHNYCTILNTHAKIYGNEGRVFLCSLHSYQEIVNEFSDSDSLEDKWFRNDFAVLEYSDTRGKSTSVYKATLDGKLFKVKRSMKGFPPVDTSEVKRVFSNLSRLNPGEIDPSYQVMRWQIDLQAEMELWAQKLRELFVDRERDVIHLVFFAEHAFQDINAKEELRKKIRDVKSILDDLKEDNSHHIHCKDVWFGEFHVAPANDSRTNGRIRNDESRKFPYLLFMRFANKKSLDQWYKDDKHSDVRRKLFESFNPEIAALFTQIDEIATANPSDVNISTIYDQIEEHVSNYMGRRDYKEAETIIDIVEKKPFRPQIRFP